MAKTTLAASGAIAIAATSLVALVGISLLMSGMATAQRPNVIELAAAQADPIAYDPFGVAEATEPDQASARSDAAAADPFGSDLAGGVELADDASVVPASFLDSEARILEQLGKQTEFQYLDQPLRDVMDDIQFRHDLPIVLDTRALENQGIGTDTPVTMSLSGVSLKSALRLMVNKLDLAYIIQDEVLQITTPEQAQESKQIHVYQVNGLVPHGESGGPTALVSLLQLMTEDEGAEIVPFGQQVVVKAPFGEHERIMQLLRVLSGQR